MELREVDSVSGANGWTPGRGSRPGARAVAGSQSVYRAIDILRTVASAREAGITASEIARLIGLTPATTHRILKVLAGEELLTVDPYTKRYNLGLELYVFGHAAREFRVRDMLAGRLERLRSISDETVFLLMRSGNDSLCLERLDGTFPIRALTLSRGSRRALGVGAGGIALLAAEDDESVERIIMSNAPHYADYPGLSADAIRSRVKDTRERGFSFNDGTLRDGVRAVGLAIGPPGAHPVASVSIAVASHELTAKRRRQLEKFLREGLSRIDWSHAQPEPSNPGEGP